MMSATQARANHFLSAGITYQGAASVLVGRAPLYGVAAGGEAGAARALEILVSDLRRVMALLGCASVSALGPEHILPGR